MNAFDARELRTAFGAFMSGVTVVTAVSERDVPVGFTANSFTSVSLDPPLLLVCPARSLTSFSVFETCSHFAVNILSENQQDVSNTFATSKGDRFAQVGWRADAWGCPIFDGVAASFSCATHERMEAGDHLVLVGRISAFRNSGAAGLGYCNSGYFSLGMERRAQQVTEAGRSVMVGAIIEHDGRVLLEETPKGVRPPQVAAGSLTGTLAAISGHLSHSGLRVEFGPVYSIFENEKTGASFTYYRAVAADADPRGLGRYIPIDDIGSCGFASGAVSDMLDRYLLERRNGVFGVYVGGDVEGDVHLFGEDRQQT